MQNLAARLMYMAGCGRPGLEGAVGYQQGRDSGARVKGGAPMCMGKRSDVAGLGGFRCPEAGAGGFGAEPGRICLGQRGRIREGRERRVS